MKKPLDQHHKKYPSFEIVENGPDSHGYVIKTVKSESEARTLASILQERNAYLGYGYTIRPIA